jgi:hypothetical protein
MDEDLDGAIAALEEADALQGTFGRSLANANVVSLLARLRAERGDVAGSLTAMRSAVVISRNGMNRGGFVTALERGIDVFVLCRPAESTARLVGAATRGPLRSMRMVAVHERGRRREIQARLLEQLGADAYEAAMERGAAMSYEEALDFVLTQLDAALADLEVDDG